MAHTLQEKYSNIVLAKLRKELVTKDNVIFSSAYEGDIKAGAVKIPVRGEVEVKDYDKVNGLKGTQGSTTYKTITITKDKAVNEIIDGYEANALPDNIVADRLDSAGYSMANSVDAESIGVLESQGTVLDGKTALTKTTAYSTLLDMKVQMSRAGVPVQGRYAIVAPEVVSLLLQSSDFNKNLSDEEVKNGAIGKIAGFTVYESNNMMFEDTTLVSSKKTSTEIIAGHPMFACRPMGFAVPVHIQDLSQSGTYIGASAVQGRLVYEADVLKAEAILVKRKEV